MARLKPTNLGNDQEIEPSADTPSFVYPMVIL